MCAVFLCVVPMLEIFFYIITNVDACDCIGVLYKHRKSGLKLTLGRKSLATSGSGTCVSSKLN